MRRAKSSAGPPPGGESGALDGKPTAQPQPQGREADGAEMNELVLHFIRCVDARTRTKEARQAQRCKMSRQKFHYLHTCLKVLTLEMFVQWTKGKPFTASQVLGHLERYVQQGGSIERARKCQGYLP